MPIRQPIAAGRFYAGTSARLKEEVERYLNQGQPTRDKQPWAYMLPHAGYIYCGDVIGKTLGGEKLSSRLIILCPNHTGKGTMLSVWANGTWQTPLGNIGIDSILADEIIDSGGGYTADVMAHLGEHSIEVLLPFIQDLAPEAKIVPICVGTRNIKALERAGLALAGVLKRPPNKDIGLVISSDMNHYENEEITLLKDELALSQAVEMNPAELIKITENNNISMCGAAPLALALFTANALGGADVELVAHTTSGKASGDYEHVVGYAGLRIYLK